jgi:hypothetical protein
MLERFLTWFVRWLNGGKARIPSGVVLLPDEDRTFNPNERR